MLASDSTMWTNRSLRILPSICAVEVTHTLHKLATASRP